MTVRELIRYPVKSLGGEALSECEVSARGLRGDRGWAAVTADGGLGSGKRSRRFRRVDGLFALLARLPDAAPGTAPGGDPQQAPAPEIGWPDGSWSSVHAHGVDGRLSEHCGQPIRLRPEGAQDVPWRDFMDSGRVSIVGTASLAAAAELLGDDDPLDPRRFRANLVIETDEPWVEERWVGRRIQVGELELVGDQPVTRCRMVDIAQVGVPQRPGVLRTLGQHRDACLALYAEPSGAGTVRLGDAVTVH